MGRTIYLVQRPSPSTYAEFLSLIVQILPWKTSVFVRGCLFRGGLVSLIMKTHNSWMKKSIKKFWMYVAYSQISIFSTKETKPKLAKEELICQAGTSRDQIHGQTFFRNFGTKISNRISGHFWRLFRCLSSCYFMRKNLLKIKLFRRFQLDIFLVSHLSHFIKAVSGAFFCQKPFKRWWSRYYDVISMTSSTLTSWPRD